MVAESIEAAELPAKESDGARDDYMGRVPRQIVVRRGTLRR